MRGRIKKIHTGKTFCFIEAEDKTEYFLHRDSFEGHWADLLEDIDHGFVVEVEFNPGKSPKGPRASDAKRLDFPNQHG